MTMVRRQWTRSLVSETKRTDSRLGLRRTTLRARFLFFFHFHVQSFSSAPYSRIAIGDRHRSSRLSMSLASMSIYVRRFRDVYCHGGHVFSMPG